MKLDSLGEGHRRGRTREIALVEGYVYILLRTNSERHLLHMVVAPVRPGRPSESLHALETSLSVRWMKKTSRARLRRGKDTRGTSY